MIETYMKPVTPHFVPFVVDRMESIRSLREIGLLRLHEGHRKKTSKKGVSSKSRGRTKKVELNAKARTALAGLDDATRAFLEANM